MHIKSVSVKSSTRCVEYSLKLRAAMVVFIALTREDEAEFHFHLENDTTLILRGWEEDGFSIHDLKEFERGKVCETSKARPN